MNILQNERKERTANIIGIKRNTPPQKKHFEG